MDRPNTRKDILLCYFAQNIHVAHSELLTWVLHSPLVKSRGMSSKFKFLIQVFSKTYEPFVIKVRSNLGQRKFWGKNCRAITHRKVDSANLNRVRQLWEWYLSYKCVEYTLEWKVLTANHMWSNKKKTKLAIKYSLMSAIWALSAITFFDVTIDKMVQEWG